MKALISKSETVETGYRVAQVAADNAVFEVSSDLFWVDCPDDLLADTKWFDPEDNSFKDVIVLARPQPITQGAQTL